MRMYHGPDREPARRRQAAQGGLGLGAHGQVVVDHRHLPVEHEVAVGRIGLEPGEQVVEQIDQTEPEGLERRVPLAVPVGVGDDDDLTHVGRLGDDYFSWMPTFVMLSILGPDGFATVRDHPARILEVNREVESMGARVISQYAVLGQWDFLTVIEAPDEKVMVRITTALAARGTLKTRTLGAIPIDEYIESLGDGVGGPLED